MFYFISYFLRNGKFNYISFFLTIIWFSYQTFFGNDLNLCEFKHAKFTSFFMLDSFVCFFSNVHKAIKIIKP